MEGMFILGGVSGTRLSKKIRSYILCVGRIIICFIMGCMMLIDVSINIYSFM